MPARGENVASTSFLKGWQTSGLRGRRERIRGDP
jgi:hypothetical protein